ncbi:7986_t:CDS:2 [Ambispora gerdemannii]|uniref:7986_t:CDS:1 n=1 Tax=Ambispora gerdemannii TaxID=144530 RepID=A0A9N9B5W2_9GLOM|nr:7986_t:CDS:2 [Ambispora gerdemannii]
MASTLATLCLHEIIKYFYVSEGEGCANNELNKNRQLFRFALVNRHWCDTAIPLLWRRPFPLISANTNTQPLFHYNIFIKQLSLRSLSTAIIDWQKSKRYHNQQESRKNDAPAAESHFEAFKAICHNLIDSPANIFFEITIDYNYNIFQIINSKASLGQLHSLKISLIYDAELLKISTITHFGRALEIILEAIQDSNLDVGIQQIDAPMTSNQSVRNVLAGKFLPSSQS